MKKEKSCFKQNIFSITIWGLILLFRGVHYIGIQWPIMCPDSWGYISLDWNFFFENFVSNTGQAPVYPTIIALCRVFGEHYLEVVIGLQMIVSLSALVALYHVLRMLHISYYLRMVLVFLYGASPAVCGWDGCVLTESFSLSCTVWFLFFIIRYIKAGGSKNAVAATLLTFIMTFLRPQFLYVFAALFLFFILKSIFEETETKTNRKITMLMIVQTILILIYCANFKTWYGVFSLSDALPRQNLIVCMERGYYKEFENTEMAELLDDYVDSGIVDWNGYRLAVERFGNAEIASQTKRFFQTHPRQYIRDTMNVMIRDFSSVFRGGDYRTEEDIRAGLPWDMRKILEIQESLFGNLKVGEILVVSILEGFAMAYVWIEKKQPPWVHMALFSISVCTTYLTYFVTCGEYMRTMNSALPYFYIMIGLFLQWTCSTPGPESRTRKEIQ